MPNLNQIYSLKERYFSLNKNDFAVKDFIEKSEAKNIIEKAFRNQALNESNSQVRNYSFFLESLNVRKPDLITYFEEGREEDVVLLFIDITSFSKTIQGWSNARIKNYLDAYYEKVIPIIYEHGGEIEKLLGDGIICVFGKPFLNLESPFNVYEAEACAEAVIKKFYGTNKSLKVAIHKGMVNYYKVPDENYGEYTIIGQPITDLYRLESVSIPNAINFFSDSSYDSLGWKYSRFDNTLVSCRGFISDNLQGVDFNEIKYLQFPNYK